MTAIVLHQLPRTPGESRGDPRERRRGQFSSGQPWIVQDRGITDEQIVSCVGPVHVYVEADGGPQKKPVRASDGEGRADLPLGLERMTEDSVGEGQVRPAYGVTRLRPDDSAKFSCSRSDLIEVNV